MTKYDVCNAINVTYISNCFEDAMSYCDFFDLQHCDDIDQFDKNAKLLNAYQRFVDNEPTCIILLMTYEDKFILCISHSYYAYYATLKDINSHIIAYLIRNATKPIDDYNESVMFFAKFFLHHPELADPMTLKVVIETAVDEDIEMTYVDAKAYKYIPVTKINQA